MCESELKIDRNGTRKWYLNGRLHRTDGPAEEWADGTRVWYQNGQRHRTDGPAIEYANGTLCWFHNGQRHRTDGPAVEYASGSTEYWIQGVRVNETICSFFENGLISVDDLLKNS